MAGILRLTKVFVLNIAIAILLSGLVEAVVRLFFPEILPIGTDRALLIDPRYGSSAGLRPGATGLSDGTLFRVDQLGFWSYDAVADSNARGWLLLGDSVTMGMGVEPDSTFAGRLALSQRKHRILNASLVGYSSSDYVNVARALLAQSRLRIQHVTVFWCLNDVYSDVGTGGLRGDELRRSVSGILAFFQTNYRTYQLLRNLLFDRPATYFENDSRYYATPGEQWKAAGRDLRALRDICTKAGAKLDVVLLPYLVQLRNPNRVNLLPQQVVKTYLLQMDVPSYDPASFMIASHVDPKEFYRYGDGIHFSPLGHKMIYAFLASVLPDPESAPATNEPL